MPGPLCSVGLCNKNIRLDNKSKRSYSYVKTDDVLEKLRWLNPDVNLNDPVCNYCRFQANEAKKRRSTENRNNEATETNQSDGILYMACINSIKRNSNLFIF